MTKRMDESDRRDFEAHYEDARDWYDWPEPCPHEHTEVDSKGIRYCVDCGEDLEDD